MPKKPKAKAESTKARKITAAKIPPKSTAKKSLSNGTQSPAASRAVNGTARENSKQAQLIEILKHLSGATIHQLMDATGWQQHSVRGFLSGTLKKKLGLTIASSKTKDGVRTYRIEGGAAA